MIDMNLSDAALLVTDIHCQSYQRVSMGFAAMTWKFELIIGDQKFKIQNSKCRESAKSDKKHAFICEGLSYYLTNVHECMNYLDGWIDGSAVEFECVVMIPRDISGCLSFDLLSIGSVTYSYKVTWKKCKACMYLLLMFFLYFDFWINY